MNKTLTIAYVTSRMDPQIDWFLASLHKQLAPDDKVDLIVVDFYANARMLAVPQTIQFEHVWWGTPKPTVWQGPSKLTKEHWWAMSNARNTAVCLCRTEWIVFLDDRSLLLPGWLDAVKEAMHYGYAVAGTYEKVHNLVVQDGESKSYVPQKENSGQDSRAHGDTEIPMAAVRCPGEWFFGGSVAVPLEWMLQINGYDETCDGLSMEDVICGLMLQNNGYPVCYDRRMRIMEDRTPNGTGKPMKREDKGKSPEDKSHAMLSMLRGLKRSMHQWDLRKVREDVLAGKPWPEATTPTFDWYDGQPLSEM